MTNNTLRIRAATPADNVLLAEFGAHTFFETFAKDNTLEDMSAYLVSSFNPEKQAAELVDPKTLVLIAEVDTTPVGYVQLRLSIPPCAVTGRKPIEIVRFYSATAWIGRGVGAALMSACLALAAEKGCDTIWLDVWEKNARAIAFYQKWGFEVVGTQSFQLGSDCQNDFLMQRCVAAG